MRSFQGLFLALTLFAVPLAAQVGRGTLFHSISSTQNAGVTSVRLPGNPSITTNEIMAWGRNHANGGCRVLYNAQHLGILFGDRNGDGRPFDWPDIDALALDPTRTIPAGAQPSPYDFLYSFTNDVVNAQGFTVVRSGDILRLNGVNSFSVAITETAFQAALGTTARLNVDAFDMLADGALLVSFRGSGTGNNIINPLSGSVGTNVSFTGADIFIIRAPYGTAPAIFAWRTSDLQAVTSLYGYPQLTEVEGVSVQPGTGLLTNPWDPTRQYQNGGRPHPLWLVSGDDNIFCINPALNPRTTADHFYALVGFGSGTRAGYSTNLSNARVILDAFEVGDFEIGSQTRLTLDASSLTPNAGSSFTLSVRGAEAAGTVYQILLSSTLDPGPGIALGGAAGRLHLRGSDPLFLWGLDPLVSPLFATMVADADGTANSISYTLPNAPGATLYFQAIKPGGSFPITGPIFVRLL